MHEVFHLTDSKVRNHRRARKSEEKTNMQVKANDAQSFSSSAGIKRTTELPKRITSGS